MAQQWPTREQWAKARRTIYAGDEIPPEYLARCTDEVMHAALRHAARAELEALWKALGPLMRGAQYPIADRLYRAGRISVDEFTTRCDTPADDARSLRHTIRRDLKNNYIDVPCGYTNITRSLPDVTRAHPLLDVHRYLDFVRERNRRAYDDWERDVATRPVDDAAWARELTRRERIDCHLEPKERAAHDGARE